MRFWRRCSVALLALASFGATSDAPKIGTDVFGRPLEPRLGRGWPAIVVYANQQVDDAISKPLRELSDRLFNEPYITVVHVDLRGVPSMFHGIARNVIRDKHKQSIEHYRSECRRRGVEPYSFADHTLIFIADGEGRSHTAMGLRKNFKEAFMVVLDGDGNEVARGPYPRAAPALEKALRQSIEQVPRDANLPAFLGGGR